MRKMNLKGFTLIELLIVIGLIAVLAGAVIIVLNPARQFSNARDSERWSHLSAIMGSIQTNTAENRGNFSGTCTLPIPATTTKMASGAGNYDICDCIVPTYSAALPFDPLGSAIGAHFTSCDDYDTGYTISKNISTGRVTLTADPEIAAAISLTQ